MHGRLGLGGLRRRLRELGLRLRLGLLRGSSLLGRLDLLGRRRLGLLGLRSDNLCRRLLLRNRGLRRLRRR